MKQVEHKEISLMLLLLLHPFNGLFYRTTWVSGNKKINHSGFYWSERWWGSSGISWTICKSFAAHTRQITTPVPHHSVFTGRMPFLLPNQQCQSIEGRKYHQYELQYTMATAGTVKLMQDKMRHASCHNSLWQVSLGYS